MKGFMALLGGGRAGVSRWSRGLGLWLACVMALPTFAQGRPDIVWMQGGRSDSVTSVAFSPDGSLLASGSLDGTIRLWRVADGSEVHTLTGHTGGVWSVSFSPDGNLLASGGFDRTIRLWRVADGSLVRTLTGHWSGVSSVSFSPDGRWLASGGDRTIRLWRVSDGALLQTYDQETGTGVLSIQFSPNGRLFGYGRYDATVVVARNPFWQNGDVNGDGCVDDADLFTVLSGFGQSDSGLADLNGDGVVDDADLLEVLFHFGSGC